MSTCSVVAGGDLGEQRPFICKRQVVESQSLLHSAVGVVDLDLRPPVRVLLIAMFRIVMSVFTAPALLL